MAIGDEAASENFPLVPNTGEEGRVRWGAREINRTRDFVAMVRKELRNIEASIRSSILGVWPVNRGGTGATDPGQARINLGVAPTYHEHSALHADNAPVRWMLEGSTGTVYLRDDANNSWPVTFMRDGLMTVGKIPNARLIGLNSGFGEPFGGQNGDIYFKVL